MERRTFIKAGCMACMSIGFVGTLLESCVSVKYVNGSLGNDGVSLDLKEFENGKKGIRQYVIVRHDDLQFPICVYYIAANQYTALLMRCTHQGAELQVSGDTLTCSAHGSEFDKTGKVLQAPASEDLRSFPVTIDNNKLFIDLRKKV